MAQNLKRNDGDDAGKRLSYEEAVEKAGGFILIQPGIYSNNISGENLSGNFLLCGLLLMYSDSKKLLLLLLVF